MCRGGLPIPCVSTREPELCPASRVAWSVILQFARASFLSDTENWHFPRDFYTERPHTRAIDPGRPRTLELFRGLLGFMIFLNHHTFCPPSRLGTAGDRERWTRSMNGWMDGWMRAAFAEMHSVPD